MGQIRFCMPCLACLYAYSTLPTSTPILKIPRKQMSVQYQLSPTLHQRAQQPSCVPFQILKQTAHCAYIDLHISPTNNKTNTQPNKMHFVKKIFATRSIDEWMNEGMKEQFNSEWLIYETRRDEANKTETPSWREIPSLDCLRSRWTAIEVSKEARLVHSQAGLGLEYQVRSDWQTYRLTD